MSFVHRDNIEVRPLEEELKDLGLDPEKVCNEIERQSGLLATRQMVSASGLPEGDKSLRSINDVGQSLVSEEKKPTVETETVADKPIAEQSFTVTKKARGAAARRARRERHREYLKGRGAYKLASKLYRAKKHMKIQRTEKLKAKKYGAKRLEKMHAQGKRISRKKSLKQWSDQISNLREELQSINTATEATKVEYRPYEEALLNASILALYLGEVFDAVGDSESGSLLFDLSRVAESFHEEMQSVSEPTEEQETKLAKILDGIIKSYSVYEDMGSPSLGDAISVALWEQNGEDEEDAEDVEDSEDEEEDGEENGKGEKKRKRNGSCEKK